MTTEAKVRELAERIVDNRPFPLRREDKLWLMDAICEIFTTFALDQQRVGAERAYRRCATHLYDMCQLAENSSDRVTFRAVEDRFNEWAVASRRALEPIPAPGKET